MSGCAPRSWTHVKVKLVIKLPTTIPLYFLSHSSLTSGDAGSLFLQKAECFLKNKVDWTDNLDRYALHNGQWLPSSMWGCNHPLCATPSTHCVGLKCPWQLVWCQDALPVVYERGSSSLLFCGSTATVTFSGPQWNLNYKTTIMLSWCF